MPSPAWRRAGSSWGWRCTWPTRWPAGRGWYAIVRTATPTTALRAPRRDRRVGRRRGAGGVVSARGGDAVRVLLLAPRVPARRRAAADRHAGRRGRGGARARRGLVALAWPSASGRRSARRATGLSRCGGARRARGVVLLGRARPAAAALRGGAAGAARRCAPARLRARRAPWQLASRACCARARWPASSPPSACRHAGRRPAGRVRPEQRAARPVLARLGRRRGGDARRHLRARHRHRGARRADRRVLRRHERRADRGRHRAGAGDLPAERGGLVASSCAGRRAAPPVPASASAAWRRRARRAVGPRRAWSAGERAEAVARARWRRRRRRCRRRSGCPWRPRRADGRAPQQREQLTAGLRTAAAMAKPTATAKPTCRLGTAASSL